MKQCMLLSLLLPLGCMYVAAAPVADEDIEQGSCGDASALGAAGLALTKINQDRLEGYIFALHHLSNVHITKHGSDGIVFYLTLDVVETNCSVLSKKDWKACEARPTHDTPVYGQCKAAIYISKVHRVARLYKYDCVLRPVPGSRVHSICPGCSSSISLEDAQVQKAVTLSLEKFHTESGLSKRFALLKVQRARAGMATGMYYYVEYTIQEINCTKSTAAADECPLMEWELAHKGFCKASIYQSLTGEAGNPDVECEIYEPEAAGAENKPRLVGGLTDHSHKDAHTHDHDHTKSHRHCNTTQKRAGDSDHHHHHHHHTRHHEVGGSHHHTRHHGVGSGHRPAHNHSGDSLRRHHNHWPHHRHHHHHHHQHHEHDHPVGLVRFLPDMEQPITLPSFPDVPAGGPEVGVTLPLKPDPQVPGQTEPIIKPFPKAISADCGPAPKGDSLVEKVFAEDPIFKPAA
ncbi:alpha-2-HS-glycoprotein-like [Spinachia spinachia]